MGISRGITRGITESGGGSSATQAPVSLFRNSEPGAWYDPSDYARTMFQDHAGTTPCTAAGQPVGLALDKRLGNPADNLSAELATNGDFSAGATGWTNGSNASSSIVSGELQITSPGPPSATANNLVYQTIGSHFLGRRYAIEFDATWVSGGDLVAGVQNAASAPVTAAQNGGVKQRYVRYVSEYSGSGTRWVGFAAAIAVASVWKIDNVSIRQVLGNHAFQETSASRPMLGQMPESDIRRNLYLWTGSLEGTFWQKYQTTYVGGYLIDTALADQHYLRDNAGTVLPVATGQVETFSVYAKPGTLEWMYMFLDGVGAFFDLTNGVTGAVGSGITTTISEPDADGYRRYAVTKTRVNASTTARIYVTNANNVTSYLGTGTGSIQINRPQFEQGTLTDYQHVSTNVYEGPRNQLTYTEDYTNAIWSKVGATITPNATTNADGSGMADAVMEITGSSAPRLVTATILSTGTTYTVTFDAKANGRTVVRCVGIGVAALSSYFTLTGDGSVAPGAFSKASITPLGNGWYRCTHTFTTTGTGGIAFWTTDGTGDDTKGVYLDRIQVEFGSVATPYQKVVSVYDLTEAGKKNCLYLDYDGVDDFLQTNAIDFTATNKMYIAASLKKLSDAADQTLMNMFGGGNGGFILALSATSITCHFGTTRSISLSGISIQTDVWEGQIDGSSSPYLSLRVGSAIATPGIASPGAGNFINSGVNIGRRTDGVRPGKFRTFGWLFIGRQTTTNEQTKTRKYLNKKAGL